MQRLCGFVVVLVESGELLWSRNEFIIFVFVSEYVEINPNFSVLCGTILTRVVYEIERDEGINEGMRNVWIAVVPTWMVF